jgi:hypothetical protein
MNLVEGASQVLLKQQRHGAASELLYLGEEMSGIRLVQWRFEAALEPWHFSKEA